MILEALNYAASFPGTPADFRPFLRSSVSLWSRARRCRSDWQPHEARCHQAVLEVLSLLPSRRTCVVLGSGLLRDVPIRQMGAAFDTVVLVDLVHLASVRVSAIMRGYRNLRFIHRDILGFDALQAGAHAEPLAFLRSVPYLDCVISANIASQLGIGAGRRLDREAPGMDDAKRSAISASVIRAHVEGLRTLPCPALLLTDTGFDIVNRSGHTEDSVDLMHGVELPPPDGDWNWLVAPLGEVSKNYALRHQVISHLFNRPGRFQA